MHLGNAIMSFYSALIDLLGRCAPEMHVREILSAHFVQSLWTIEIKWQHVKGQDIYGRERKYGSVLCLQLIQAGKGEALRIRAILRSLVPIEDLVGVISLPVQIPTYGKGRTQFIHLRL